MFGDFENMDDDGTLDVSTIVVDISWEFELVPIMANNHNEDYYERSVGRPKESGKGDCDRG